jgi:ketosteroid isomerase-like protein
METHESRDTVGVTSPGNVAQHRCLNAAFNERDADALVAICDPLVEIHSVFTAVGGAIYTGHEGARQWLDDIIEAWTGFQVSDDVYFDLPEQTLAFVVLRGTGSVSGAEVLMPYAQVMRWRHGQCTWFKAYANRDDALGDLGVSEENLEPC